MPHHRILMTDDNTKLIISLGFTAVLGLMFILIFIALNQLQLLNQRMSRVVEETNVKTEAAHTMREAIRLRANALKSMQLTDDMFERDEHFLQMPDYAGMYRVARETLLSKDLDAREEEIQNRLKNATIIAQPINDHAAELLRGDASGQQIEDAIREAEKAQTVLFRLLMNWLSWRRKMPSRP